MIKIDTGYISIHRKITENWLWSEKPFDKGRAWIDLLLMVNHEDAKIMFNGSITEVKRSQRITSIRFLSERWGWSPTKTKKFLEQLKSDGMIDYFSDTKKTVVTIGNYDLYQYGKTKKVTSKNIKSKTEVKQKNTNNNDNNENNDNNIYAQQVEQLWSLYPNKQGKATAIKKIPKLIEQYGYEKIETCIKRYAEEVKGRDKKYIKHGSTFFNSGYMDYLEDNSSSEEDEPRYYWVEDPNTGEQIRKRVGE